MATKLLNREPAMDNIRQFGIFDDFCGFAVGNTALSSVSSNWIVTKDTTATVLIDADGVGGVLQMTTNAAVSDEAYIETLEVYKVASDKPQMAVMRAKLDCSTANKANAIFGFMDGVAADAIDHTNLAPAASKHLACFYKPDGTDSVRVYSTSSAAGTYTQSTCASTIDEDWVTYLILVEPVSSTDKRITYYMDVDGGQNWKQVKDSTSGQLIKHRWTLADTVEATGELSLMAGVKAGSAEAQVLSIDYIGAWQLR